MWIQNYYENTKKNKKDKDFIMPQSKQEKRKMSITL